MTQHVNLLQENLRQGRDWAHGGAVLLILLTTACAVGGHWAYEQWAWSQAAQTIADAQASREANTAQTQQLTAQIAEIQSQLQADEEMRKASAEMIDPPQRVVARFESLVAGLTPSMWIQNLAFKNARGVHLVVSGLKQGDLAQYANTISALPDFKGLPIQVLGVERKTWDLEESDASGATAKKSVPYYSFEMAARENWEEASDEEGQP